MPSDIQAPGGVKPNKRGAQSRETVLDAAEKLMAEQGYEAASLNQVVATSGIPISSVYHYYGSKDKLLLAVMERGAQRFFDALPELDERAGTAEEHLRLVIQGAATVLAGQPDFLRLLVVMAAQPPVGAIQETAEVVARVRGEAIARLKREVSRTFDIPEDSDVAAKLAAFGLATFDGTYIASQGDESISLEDLPDLLTPAIIGLYESLDINRAR
jgi:AcrR family transcriptional regulator